MKEYLIDNLTLENLHQLLNSSVKIMLKLFFIKENIPIKNPLPVGAEGLRKEAWQCPTFA
jgi:hypothetical protein